MLAVQFGWRSYLPAQTWVLSYVGYRGAPSNSSGWLENFQGTIYARYASSAGDAGLDSDFHDSTYRSTDSVLLTPDDFQVDGPWPHVCQGLQVSVEHVCIYIVTAECCALSSPQL
jgi:hypothetical protein